uniref:Uncharacterized protein n=1 Tax=Anopheles funestus TaxID=62324 RepID=A0A4Y0BF87_ANOFN
MRTAIVLVHYTSVKHGTSGWNRYLPVHQGTRITHINTVHQTILCPLTAGNARMCPKLSSTPLEVTHIIPPGCLGSRAEKKKPRCCPVIERVVRGRS